MNVQSEFRRTCVSLESDRRMSGLLLLIHIPRTVFTLQYPHHNHIMVFMVIVQRVATHTLLDEPGRFIHMRSAGILAVDHQFDPVQIKNAEAVRADVFLFLSSLFAGLVFSTTKFGFEPFLHHEKTRRRLFTHRSDWGVTSPTPMIRKL